MKPARKRLAILISGRGSNMQALIDACRSTSFPAEVAVVVASRANAGGLVIAERAGIKTAVIAKEDFSARPVQENRLEAILAQHRVELICLAGWMRLISPALTERWAGRMLNIHPSLLPLFKGLHPHAQALQAGVRVHGCSVHFVTAETDGGPIIAQAAVAVGAGDTEDGLAARVLAAEHRLYPLALRLVAESRVRLENGRSIFSQTVPADRAMLISPQPDAAADVEALARFTP